MGLDITFLTFSFVFLDKYQLASFRLSNLDMSNKGLGGKVGGEGGMGWNIGLLASHPSHLTRYRRKQKQKQILKLLPLIILFFSSFAECRNGRNLTLKWYMILSAPTIGLLGKLCQITSHITLVQTHFARDQRWGKEFFFKSCCWVLD